MKVCVEMKEVLSKNVIIEAIDKVKDKYKMKILSWIILLCMKKLTLKS